MLWPYMEGNKKKGKLGFFLTRLEINRQLKPLFFSLSLLPNAKVWRTLIQELQVYNILLQAHIKVRKKNQELRKKKQNKQTPKKAKLFTKL